MFASGINPTTGEIAPGRQTVQYKVLHHLLKFERRLQEDAIVSPRQLTQEGIAEVCDISRAHAAVALTKLRGRGWVSWRLIHVDGKKRKVRCFTVTATAVTELRSGSVLR